MKSASVSIAEKGGMGQDCADGCYNQSRTISPSRTALRTQALSSPSQRTLSGSTRCQNF